jgi:hypothetical protein
MIDDRFVFRLPYIQTTTPRLEQGAGLGRKSGHQTPTAHHRLGANKLPIVRTCFRTAYPNFDMPRIA